MTILTQAELAALPVGTEVYTCSVPAPNFVKTDRGWEPISNPFGLYWPQGRFDHPVRRERWSL